MATIATSEHKYDVVDKPDRDFFCPVSLELLTRPQQTACCGNHISQEAADRLVREGKSCPLCKKEKFKTTDDLYFKRKVHQWKVYCTYKEKDCEWVGELGEQNQHTIACPKRPWECPYCALKTTHDNGTTNHAPQCEYKPVPCPNHCETGTVPRCRADDHLLKCPLQIVNCDFVGSGCKVKVPRKDLASHVEKNVQHHLMTATLLNLQLTKDLQQKMEEKDQQIIHLQTQLKQMDVKIDTTISKVTTAIETNSTILHNELLKLRGFTCHEITLTEFALYQISGGDGLWSSATFSNIPIMHPFSLEVYTNGFGKIRTHFSLYLLKHHNFEKTKGAVIFELLNQLEDRGHFVGRELNFSSTDPGTMKVEFFPLVDLGYNANSNTQYLKDDCLKFRLFLKVENL